MSSLDKATVFEAILIQDLNTMTPDPLPQISTEYWEVLTLILNRISGRRSIRLQGYDYRTPGAYFVTIVTRNHQQLFGHVISGRIRLNSTGRIVKACWEAIPEHFGHVKLDEFIVMPPQNKSDGLFGMGVTPGSLGAVVRSFKSAATRQVNRMRPGSRKPVWQRNYYDHIIRNEYDLNRIREYILQNPFRWKNDRNG